MEKLCDIEIKIKCPFCQTELKQPRLWETCPKCKSIIMVSYKAVARRNFKPKINNEGGEEKI